MTGLLQGGSVSMGDECSAGEERLCCDSNLEEVLLVGGAGANSSGNVAGRLLRHADQGDQALATCIDISTKNFTTS